MTGPRPRRLARGLVALLAAALLWPSAHAEAAAYGPKTALALQVAERQWGPVCGGHFALGWAALPREYDGYATWWRNGDGSLTDCRITMTTLRSLDWPRFCSVLVHEVGHLAGHPHSDDPRSPMHIPVPVVAACTQARRR